MHSIDRRRPRAHWRVHAQRCQKKILKTIALARAVVNWLPALPSRLPSYFTSRRRVRLRDADPSAKREQPALLADPFKKLPRSTLLSIYCRKQSRPYQICRKTSEVESEVANEFDNFHNRFVAHVILNRDNYRNNLITSVTSVTSVDGLHWYLSGPKAERHVRYRIAASSNQIKEKLEQECPTYIFW